MKPISSVFRSALLCLLAAGACAAQAAGGNPASAPDLPPTLARLKSEGVIRIGVREGAAPFAYFDKAGEPQGFTVDLCNAIVKNLEQDIGRPLTRKVVPVTLANSFDKLQDGSIDIQCGSTTHPAEREAKAAFSNTFFIAGIRIAYRKGDPDYSDPQRFGRVIALANSTAAGLAKKRLSEIQDSSRLAGQSTVATYADGVAKLKAKEADTFFGDSVLIPSDPAIVFRDRPLTVEPYALMMRRGDNDFVAAVNKAMASAVNLQGQTFANNAGIGDKINSLTKDAWRNPSSDVALSMY